MALRESEEKFRGVFDQAMIIALVSVPESTSSNSTRRTRAFGYSRDEVLGGAPAELGLWVIAGLRDAYLEQLRTTGFLTGFESQLRRKNGETFTVLQSGCVVALAGRPYNIASWQDITARKQSEAALDRSLALIRATLESAADGILVVNADGHIATYNQVFAEMWQIEHHETVDRGEEERLLRTILGQLVVPEDFLVSVRDALRPVGRGCLTCCVAGTACSSATRARSCCGSAGRPGVEFPRHHRATAGGGGFARKRGTLSGAGRCFPAGIFSSDPDGRTTFVNRRWCEIAGISAAQAMGDGWRSALHPDDSDRVVAGWKQAVQAGESVAAEFRFVRPDGSVTWLVGQSRAQTRPDGSRAGYVGTITDVTSLKRAVEEQKKAEAQLRQVQKMESLGTLAGGIAHDFNNILTGTFGFVDLARLELPETHRAHAWLDRISASSNAPAISSGRSSRSAANRKASARRSACISSWPRPCVCCSRPSRRSSNWNRGLPTRRPSSPTPRRFTRSSSTSAPTPGTRCRPAEADHRHLEAWTVGPAQAATQPDTRRTRLAVADNGSGMDAGRLEHIFEPFFTTKATAWAGPGLAVVHGIVKLHAGPSRCGVPSVSAPRLSSFSRRWR